MRDMTVFNPKILDASIRDVVFCLTDEQKADTLLYAMSNLQHEGYVSVHLLMDFHLAFPFRRYKTIIDNAVQSCLQIPTLSPENMARARVLRAQSRLAAGSNIGAEQGLSSLLSWTTSTLF